MKAYKVFLKSGNHLILNVPDGVGPIIVSEKTTILPLLEFGEEAKFILGEVIGYCSSRDL